MIEVYKILTGKYDPTLASILHRNINKFVRPRWPYDMRPSARGEKYMCVIVIR